MNRFSRINTIWRKELIDTLRDKRTVIAMVLVPLVLYPALMLGSLQAFEVQTSRLKQECYKIGVTSDDVRRWLQRVLDTDPARRIAGPGAAAEEVRDAANVEPHSDRVSKGEKAVEAARADVRTKPPPYEIYVLGPDEQMAEAVMAGRVHMGLLIDGPLPTPDGNGSARLALVYDQTEIRSEIAAAGLDGILQRANEQMVLQRLQRLRLDAGFIAPLALEQKSVTTPERLGGSILGQIVPLILIMMTITGAIYPAIDLTAGERERGTLETLMVAPVPTVDLIAGKFVVVTLIGLLSAVLNLASIGGTIYFGGLGDLLSRGSTVQFPLSALPKILLLLVPMAVLFSAMLLAVCSFARSFKEAQNYIVPVMIAALIPGVVGVLPGTRLEGPILIMPVANVVVLARDLFMGRESLEAILWVTLSTSLYAAAAVAVAAKLFGQEAVLFADSASIKTLFQRRFFRPQIAPSAAQAFLLLALVYPLNFFIQRALAQAPLLQGNIRFFCVWALVMLLLFLLGPLLAALYMRVAPRTTFSLRAPPAWAVVAALCFGGSTWVLAQTWFWFQQAWLPMDPHLLRELERQMGWIAHLHPAVVFFFMAAVPAICEEFFFRGYALGGLRKTLGGPAAVLIVGVAFGVYHGSVHRLFVTAMLGFLFGLLVLRGGSLWPAMLAHLMHNGISILSSRPDGLRPFLERVGYESFTLEQPPPLGWTLGAALLVLAGIGLCVWGPRWTPRPLAGPLLNSEPAR